MGGHYYPGLSSDPWNLDSWKYQTDASGVAFIELALADFSLEGMRAVAGRTMVAHLSSMAGGTRAACGVIVPSAAELTTVANERLAKGRSSGAKGNSKGKAKTPF